MVFGHIKMFAVFALVNGSLFPEYFGQSFLVIQVMPCGFLLMGLPTKRSGRPRFAKLLPKVCLWGVGWPFISATVSKRATIPATSYLTWNVSACLSTKALYCPLLMDRFYGPKVDQLLIQLVIVFRLVVQWEVFQTWLVKGHFYLGWWLRGPWSCGWDMVGNSNLGLH